MDFVIDCKLFMQEKGFSPPDQIIADGKIHRFSTDDNKYKRDEWYLAYEGMSFKGNHYLICVFGSWSDSSQYKYQSFDNTTYKPEEKELLVKKIENQIETVQCSRLFQIKISSFKARKLWNEYSPHPLHWDYIRYLEAKKIDKMPLGNIKFGINPFGKPSLIIPVMDVDKKIQTLQFISQSSRGKSFKMFLYGGQKKGNFFVIGELSDNSTIYITEGYATGITVHYVTNKSVVIAFDAGNLKPVIQVITRKFTGLTIIIAADRDETGLKKALEAGDYLIVYPIFKTNKKYTDFNDLYQLYGIEETRKQLLHYNN